MMRRLVVLALVASCHGASKAPKPGKVGATLGTVLEAENIAASGTITQAGSQVFSIGSSGLVGSGAVVELLQTCSSTQVLAWNGTTWACANQSGGGSTAVVANNPLSGSGSSGSPLVFTPTDVAPFQGTGSSGSPFQYIPVVTSPLSGSGSSGSPLAWTPTLGNLQGTGSSGSPLKTNLSTTSCGTGSAETSTAADGTSTCTAFVASVAASSANGMTCSQTAAGAVTCWAGSALGCPAGDIEEDTTGGSGGWGCVAIPTGTVTGTGTAGDLTAWSTTTAVGNYAGSTPSACSGGSAVTQSSLSAAGALTQTCSAVGTITGSTLTSNTVPKATGATALANSLWTDTGSMGAYSSTALTITTAGLLSSSGGYTTASNIVSSAGYIQADLGVYSGNAGATGWFMSASNGGSLSCDYNSSATSPCAINANGYQEGVTKYRDLVDFDGEGSATGNRVFYATGSSHSVEIFNNDQVDGNETIGGHLRNTNGTALTTAALTCGASPAITGTDLAGVITVGAATTTSCTLTFSTTYTTAPYCVCSSNAVASGGVFTGCSTTATTLVATLVAGSTAQKFTYICVGP